MFGKNEIVGQKYFENYAPNTLKVTSIFYTLQGEGPFRGRPAVFIRLSKCNLACSFCDTYFDDGDILTFDDLEHRILGLLKKHEIAIGSVGLVITGGEPLLQKNIGPFLDHIKNKFTFTQIESNGIIYQNIPDDTILVISPKCSEKNGVPIKYLKPNIRVLERANCFKFVIEDNPDSPYNEVPQWALETNKDIYVSPINVYNDEPRKFKEQKMSNYSSIEERSTIDEIVSFWTPNLLNLEQNKKNHEYAGRYCMKHNLILNLQLHLYCSLA